jgi:4,5-dihydroxyphthalate decarboxylase
VPPASRRVMTLAIQRFDRTAALHTHQVQVPDLFVMHTPPATSTEGAVQGLFDGGEMPLARYIFLRDRGEPFTAIPVFTDRLFVQQYVYTRPDTGIRSPGDLRGRRVLVPTYYMTASLWHRGMLQDDHGIRPEEIEWHVTGREADERMRVPEGVHTVLSRGPRLGAELLVDGTVDCVMTEATPPLPAEALERFVRVDPDVHATQREFYRRTGFHPIVHLIVLRRQAVHERPELIAELCAAFDQAKAAAYRELQNERMVSVPLMRGYLDETMALFGDDPWPYGMERNWAELDRVLAYAHDQGLTEQRLSPEYLFDPPARDFRFQAKLPTGAVPWSPPAY